MKRSECGFTYSHYFETLERMRENRLVGPISSFRKFRRSGRKFVLLRHDIDFSPARALRLAELEHARGYTSTYFVLLTSPHYNALNPENSNALSRIAKRGHEIGLHYDASLLPSGPRKATECIGALAAALSFQIGAPIRSVSQHNVVLGRKASSKVTKSFTDARFDVPDSQAMYLSDSVMNWRGGCMHKHVGSDYSMQILTHPIWWTERAKPRSWIVHDLKKELVQIAEDSIESLERLHDSYFKTLNDEA